MGYEEYLTGSGDVSGSQPSSVVKERSLKRVSHELEVS